MNFIEIADVSYNSQTKKLKKSPHVLIAPLNWGLGHATRCIPIINSLLQNDFEVTIASDGRALKLLQKEYPNLKTINLPSYDIRYTLNNMILNIAFQIPKILRAIWKEKKEIKKVVEKVKPDIIISDNRYGCYSKKTKNIFLTHQVNIIIPIKLLEKVVNFINHKLINKFDECWIPDYAGEKSLAGKLSVNKRLKNSKYIGILSRMEPQKQAKKYDIITILSGPEPQRTRFENRILKELENSDKKSLAVLGKSELIHQNEINKNLKVVSFLDSNELNKAIEESEIVICRSGYSSIMDLIKLGKKAILVPTPGQTEQEYLASSLKQTKQFCVQTQRTFSLKKGLAEMELKGSATRFSINENGLNSAIKKLINQKFTKHLAKSNTNV